MGHFFRLCHKVLVIIIWCSAFRCPSQLARLQRFSNCLFGGWKPTRCLKNHLKNAYKWYISSFYQIKTAGFTMEAICFLLWMFDSAKRLFASVKPRCASFSIWQLVPKFMVPLCRTIPVDNFWNKAFSYFSNFDTWQFLSTLLYKNRKEKI